MNGKSFLPIDGTPWEAPIPAPIPRAGWLLASLFLLPALLATIPRMDEPLVLLVATSLALPACIAPAKALGLRHISGRDLLSVAVFYLLWIAISLPLTAGWEILLKVCHIGYAPQQHLSDVITGSTRWYARAALFWSVCINTPIVEEVLFRRMIYAGCRRVCPVAAAAAASAAVFALVHFFILGIPSLFVMGILLQGVFLRRNNLWCAIILHSLINVLSFSILLTKEFI